MKLRSWCRKVFALAIAAVLLSITLMASAEEPYTNYIYDYSGNLQEEPQAYVAEKSITGASLGIGDFSLPSDCCVGPDGRIYLADTGNNRIVILTKEYKLDRIITNFDNKGISETLNKPTGLFVTDDNVLYIADSGSCRVLALDKVDTLVGAFGRPKDPLLDKALDYIPNKVAVDQYGKIYIVAGGVNQGIVELNADGSLFGFFGAVTVESSFVQVLKRMFNSSVLKNLFDYLTTEASIPTEYSNIDIDEKGFVFGTVSIINSDSTIKPEQFIHRLNHKGKDILRRPDINPPIGDKPFYNEKGEFVVSQLCDITTCGDGIYSVLDSKEGRVFTYSDEGRLMYVFGAMGTELGTFGKPVALDITVDHHYLVVDNKYGSITVFKPTDYGKTVTEAVRAYKNRDYTVAREQWMQALNYTASSELVYDGVADSYLRIGNYKDAMKYYKYSHNHDGYSTAQKYYRNEWTSSHFGLLAIIVIGVIVLLIVWRMYKHHKNRRKNNE